MKVMFVVMRQRLVELIFSHRYREWRMQSVKAAHWTRSELGKRLEIRNSTLGDGWLGIFEAELAKLVYHELVTRKGLYRFENPPQLSPMDLYRLALIRAGIEITPMISQALPESEIRILRGYVKVKGGNVLAAPLTLYNRWASS